MNWSNSLKLISAVILLLWFLVGCGGSATAPVSEASIVTPTPEPLTSTPKLPTPAPSSNILEPTVTSVLPTPEPPATPTSQPSKKNRLVKDQITSQALANNLIGDPATRDFYVYLPASYYDAGDKRYPVVYALHGYSRNYSSLVEMRSELEKLTVSGEAREMILVFPDASNKFGGSWYLSSPTIGDYESYIAEELVAYIDANYRTLPHRDSRGITGCSMGGDGSLHLALTYPDVFSVAAPMSGLYNHEDDPEWERDEVQFRVEPEDFDDVKREWFFAGAAAAAPNPDKPPFYLDKPFEVVDGKGHIVPEVRQKIIAADVLHDLPDYLNQPVRLNGLLIYHGEYDDIAPVEVVRNFDKTLTELGVEHDYVEVNRSSGGHCNLDRTVVLKFMSDHLAF